MQPYIFVSLGIRSEEVDEQTVEIFNDLKFNDECGFMGFTEDEHGGCKGDEGIIYLSKIVHPFENKSYAQTKSITYSELENIVKNSNINSVNYTALKDGAFSCVVGHTSLNESLCF